MVTLTRRTATVSLAATIGLAATSIAGVAAPAAAHHASRASRSIHAGKSHTIPGRVSPLAIACAPGHPVTHQTCHAVVQASNSSAFLTPVVKGKPKSSPPAATGGIDVACPSTTKCLVVGSVNQQPTMEWFNGNTLSKTVTVHGANYLQGVACSSGSRCVAVGYTTVGGAAKGVFIPVKASSSTVTAKKVAGVTGLQDVSCPTATCVAVGSTGPGTSVGAAITIKGKRAKVHKAHGTTQLAAVSCGSASTCWAIGFAQTSKGVTTKILKLKSGKPGASKRAPQFGDHLACTTSTTCYLLTATSQYGKGKVERFSGGRAKGSTTLAKFHYGAPDGIACPTKSSCIVTGLFSFHNPGASFYYIGGVASLTV